MRIILLTQDEPFYLAENIASLLENLPLHSQIVATVLFDVSPYGKRDTLIGKFLKTYAVFGPMFTLRYAFLYLVNKFNSKKSVRRTLNKYKVPVVEMKESVNSVNSIQLLKSYNPELLISLAGNQIFKRQLIDIASKGCLNLHTALLPKYRGLMPSFWVMKNNEKYTGVSVFFVNEGIDSGPILVQKKIEIGDRTLEELIRYSKKIGVEAIIEAVQLINDGNYNIIENNEAEKTYYHFPTGADTKEFIRIGKHFF